MGLFKKKAGGPEPEPVRAEPVDAVHGSDPGQAREAPVEPPPDYYDWKARYRPWIGVSMAWPVVAGSIVLGILIIVLLAFLFHPSW